MPVQQQVDDQSTQRLARAYYSRAEAVAILGISQRSLDRAIADGTIPARRLGKRVLIPAAVLNEIGTPASQLVNEQQQGTDGE